MSSISSSTLFLSEIILNIWVQQINVWQKAMALMISNHIVSNQIIIYIQIRDSNSTSFMVSKTLLRGTLIQSFDWIYLLHLH
jgi:hypothetical protein